LYIQDKEIQNIVFLDSKMSSSSTENECFICESLLQPNEETITTECNHTFHLSCAQKRVDEKRKSDCRVCMKELAIANALTKHQTTTTTTQSDSKDDQPERIVCLVFFI
jgi:hypothetical protein